MSAKKEVIFTEEQRQKIATVHENDHGGVFYPDKFVDEAREKSHPAHNWNGWHGWNKNVLSEMALRDAARSFIRFKIIPAPASAPTRSTGMTLHYVPAYISPRNGRFPVKENEGATPLSDYQSGGYIPTDSPEGRKELLRQALDGEHSITSYIKRYGSVFTKEEIRLFTKAKALLSSRVAAQDGGEAA